MNCLAAIWNTRLQTPAQTAKVAPAQVCASKEGHFASQSTSDMCHLTYGPSDKVG